MRWIYVVFVQSVFVFVEQTLDDAPGQDPTTDAAAAAAAAAAGPSIRGFGGGGITAGPSYPRSKAAAAVLSPAAYVCIAQAADFNNDGYDACGAIAISSTPTAFNADATIGAGAGAGAGASSQSSAQAVEYRYVDSSEEEEEEEEAAKLAAIGEEPPSSPPSSPPPSSPGQIRADPARALFFGAKEAKNKLHGHSPAMLAAKRAKLLRWGCTIQMMSHSA
jgi:hypothetical protein